MTLINHYRISYITLDRLAHVAHAHVLNSNIYLNLNNRHLHSNLGDSARLSVLGCHFTLVGRQERETISELRTSAGAVPLFHLLHNRGAVPACWDLFTLPQQIQ